MYYKREVFRLQYLIYKTLTSVKSKIPYDPVYNHPRSVISYIHIYYLMNPTQDRC